MALAVNQIKVDLKERINSFVKETNHSFSLENYDFITRIHDNPDIAKIYKQLGPFDFYTEKVEDDAAE